MPQFNKNFTLFDQGPSVFFWNIVQLFLNSHLITISQNSFIKFNSLALSHQVLLWKSIYCCLQHPPSKIMFLLELCQKKIWSPETHPPETSNHHYNNNWKPNYQEDGFNSEVSGGSWPEWRKLGELNLLNNCVSEILLSKNWLYERLRNVKLVRREKLYIRTSPESWLWLKSRDWFWVHWRILDGKSVFKEFRKDRWIKWLKCSTSRRNWTISKAEQFLDGVSDRFCERFYALGGSRLVSEVACNNSGLECFSEVHWRSWVAASEKDCLSSWWWWLCWNLVAGVSYPDLLLVMQSGLTKICLKCGRCREGDLQWRKPCGGAFLCLLEFEFWSETFNNCGS